MSDLLDQLIAKKPKGDPLDEYLAEQRAAHSSVVLKQAPAPDIAAQANVIARQRGVPATIVEQNLPAFQKQDQVDKHNQVVMRYPAINRWASDPRNAMVAADDNENLGILGSAFEGLKNFGASLKSGLYSGTAGLWGAVGAIAENADYIPFMGMGGIDRSIVNRLGGKTQNELIALEARQRQKEGQALAAAARPDVKNWLAKNLLQGVESVPLSLISLGAGVLGSPAAGVAVMGGSVGGNEYVRAREAGLTPQRALVYGTSQGLVEYVTEKIPAGRLAGDIIAKSPIGKTLMRQIAAEVPGEQVATVLQDFNEWATLNPDKPFSSFLQDRPRAAAETLVATLGGMGATTGISIAADRTARATAKVAGKLAEARQAKESAPVIDKVMEASANVKTKRDPEAFAQLIKELADDAGTDSIYVPADAINTYMQSDGYDGSFDDYSEQVSQGLATGGDVVFPMAEAVTRLAPIWDSVKDDARLTAGGFSRREAQSFDEAMADAMAELTDKMAAQDAAEAGMRIPRDKLFQSVSEKLTNAGFTPSVAMKQAELLVQRAATRATRLGRDLTGNEYDSLSVRQVLPERLARVQKADQIDILLNAVRRGAAPDAQKGPSILDFIARAGGIEDKGGDIKAMGGDRWHREKPFRKRLIRASSNDQGSLMGAVGTSTGFGLDDYALKLWEAGYFPDKMERPSVNDLLDAIGNELSGNPTFANVVIPEDMAGAAEELRMIMAQAGIDETASKGDIKSAIDRYVLEQSQGQGYDQSFEDDPRGRITFPNAGYGSGPTVIDLFQSRDQSTFLHETGHLWLEELRFDASDPQAPQQLKDDWQAVTDWFAANGHPLADGVIPVEAHEMWARGVERYLMEGKSPVTGLKKLFADFKAWLVQTYRTAARLNAPISDEVRAVIDRLIATDEEINNAMEEQALISGFPEKPVTMTDAEWADYQKLTSDARDDASTKLLAKTMATIKRRVTKEYKALAETVRAEVATEIDARPEFKAITLLKASPMDAEWVRREYGEDALSMIPKGVPPLYKDGGADPDAIAELAGFASGDDMVRSLMGVEERRLELRKGGDQRSVRQVLIDQETDARMLDRYGDPFMDGSIEEEALAAVHNEKQGDVLAAELRVIARGTGERPTPYSAAKEWAARSLREGVVNKAVSKSAMQNYQRAASRAGKAAFDAVAKGDMEEAFRQKQAQMLNNALVSEGKKLAEQIEKAVGRLEKIATKRTMKSVDQDYLERAQGLLEQVDMRARTQRSIDKQEQFEAWAQGQEADGHDIVVPASFAASLGSTHWSRLTVEQFLGLDAAVDQIIHLGRFKQKLIDNKEARDFEELVREAEAGGDRLGRKPPSNLMEPDWKDRFKAGVATFDAALLKMETVFDWLDDGNSEGVFNRIVFRPIAEAEGREKAMLADYYERIRGAFAQVDGKQLKRWQDSYSTPELMDRNSGLPYKMKREHLIAMALNMGNEGNIQRLVDGYGWNEQNVRDVLNRELTQEDWAFVQSVLDIVDTLWPEIAALERRVNGVEPERVEAMPIETPFGTLRGGYYPAVYDTAKDYSAEVRAGKESDLLETTYTRATTRASSTKDRAARVKRPILLQLGVINRHIGEVIHDITHREAVMQANKFLSSPRVMKVIDETLNPEIRKQMRPWLKFVANQWAMERAGNEGIGKWLGKARANTTIVGMGFRASTILTQIAGYSNSYEYVGAGWVNQGIARAAQNPIATFNFVMERSAEIRGRMDSIDRDIRATMAEMAGSNKAGNALTAAKRFAFHGIGYMDRVVVIPTWIGAYNKALAEGMDEADAIYAADKAVRLSQGSGSPKDLAAVQRGTGKWGEFLKLTTMFYSYMSAFYQRERTLGRDVSRAGSKDVPALMARAFWLIVVPPVLSQILSGNGPEEDDDWGVWAFKQMLFNVLGPIPVVRDLARPIWDKAANNQGFDYQISPIQRAGQTLVNLAGDIGDVARGDDTKRMTRNTLEAIGYTTGLVPGQFASAAQFLVDVGEGEQNPQDISDWYEGLTKGKISDE